MAQRSPDGSIPPDERLFRSVGFDHVDGDQVLPTAVDLPRCSFDREKYCAGPQSALSALRPDENGVVSLVAGDLPDPVPRPRPQGHPTELPSYEFFAQDDPNPPEAPENEAHAEVRMRAVGSPYTPNLKIKDKGVLAKAKEALARKLRVEVAPTPVRGD